MSVRAPVIAALNDQLRQTLQGGLVMMTAGVQALPEGVVARAIMRMRGYSSFTADNDPHGEHDFGAFSEGGHKFFFKVDCYDRSMEFGSPDPSDPIVTMRVLTLMLASEY